MDEFKIKFRGVRGSYPVANKDFLKYGGNTIQYKRNEVAADLGVSTSTITAAIRVLADHYGAISTHRLGSVDAQGNPRCSGQEASLSAFWLND